MASSNSLRKLLGSLTLYLPIALMAMLALGSWWLARNTPIIATALALAMIGSHAFSQDGVGEDPDALRERYREEREKRLRSDGNAQYVEASGRFAHFVDDPYVAPGSTRASGRDWHRDP